MTLQEALFAATRTLTSAGIEDAGRDAKILLAQAAAVPRDRLTLHLPDQMTDHAGKVLAGYVARRMAREPVSKIIGYRAFWGRNFTVTGDVLDPRPETETLIALALQDVRPKRLLDIGTGSGVLAVTLLLELPEAEAVATDLSDRALDVARGNAGAHQVSDRLTLLRTDWFERVAGRFDLIVSNPPYITKDEMEGLAPELAHEPRMALTDEGDGLGAYRIISAQAGRYLRPGGHLMVEIGWKQGAAVAGLFSNAGFSSVRIRPDLEGRDRVVSAVKQR